LPCVWDGGCARRGREGRSEDAGGGKYVWEGDAAATGLVGLDFRSRGDGGLMIGIGGGIGARAGGGVSGEFGILEAFALGNPTSRS
jgi:hypothetical protein